MEAGVLSAQRGGGSRFLDGERMGDDEARLSERYQARLAALELEGRAEPREAPRAAEVFTAAGSWKRWPFASASIFSL